MTERILGQPGTQRKRRMKLLPLLMLVTAILLIGVSQASGAFGPTVIDENGPNDVPGQKDLNSHAIDDSGLPDSIIVRWNWDELGTSGNNTLDACALLDSDSDGFANFAACATTIGNPATLQFTTLYSCGDTRVDRCSSQIAVVANPVSTCAVAQSNTDPFPGPAAKNKGAGYPNDTRATCNITLDDFGVAVTDLDLINTCSYPSQQPNSDPSDCVLVPRDATLKIVKDAGDDTTTVFDFDVRVNTTGSNTLVEESITGSGDVSVPIIGGKPNSVEEGTLPTGWSLDSASCTDGTNNGSLTGQKISGIVAATGTTVTCTFVNIEPLATPGASTAPSLIPNDSATITGLDETGTGANLTFELHDTSDCSGTALYSEDVLATQNTTYSTSNTTTLVFDADDNGTYYWKVSFPGDDENEDFSSCKESVDFTIDNDTGN